jgi:hypothetical protein
MNYKEVKTILNLSEYAKSASLGDELFVKKIGSVMVTMNERTPDLSEIGKYREWWVLVEGYSDSYISDSLFNGKKKLSIPYSDRMMSGDVRIKGISMCEGYVKIDMVGEGALVDY